MHVGHDGAMPGFLAGVYGRGAAATAPPGACGAAVLGLLRHRRSPGRDLPHTLLRTAVEEDPAEIEPWTPGQAPPPKYALGAGPLVERGLRVRLLLARRRAAGARRGRPAGQAAGGLRADAGEPDELRTRRPAARRASGCGCTATRTPGDVVRMHWATYRFTRTQETFDTLTT